MTRRTDKVAEAIRRLASEIIHSELKDPRIKGLVTVTKVEVPPGLRFARIFYSVFGDEKKKKLVQDGLKSAKSFMRKHIADELKLRYAIDILFLPDKSAEYKERIDGILGTIQKEKENEENIK